MSELFFRDPHVGFMITGPPVSEEQILSVVPKIFSGKEEFINFYLRHNGGKLSKFVYRERRASDPQGSISRLQIDSLFFIPRDPGETFPGLRSVSQVLKQRSAAYGQLSAKGYSNLQLFFDVSYPIGTDASDNTFWLDVPSGQIRYFKWEHYETGPVPVASSFMDFVNNFEFDPSAEQQLKDFLAMVNKRKEKGPTGHK